MTSPKEISSSHVQCKSKIIIIMQQKVYDISGGIEIFFLLEIQKFNKCPNTHLWFRQKTFYEMNNN